MDSISWGEGASTRGTTDWFSVFMKWMESVSKQVYGRNGCVPASPASYMVVCLEQHVDPDVDIVFVEYVFNDGIENTLVENHVVLAMEQLVRRLLVLPGRPAVVLVQVPHVRNTDVLPFYETSEDLEGALAAYYGLSSVSLRNALFQFNSIRPTQGFLWNQTYFHHHPGDNGHKMIADLVVNLIQEVAVGLATSPVQEAELTEREQPLAPVPMYAGNFPPESASCIAGDALKAQVVSVEGWQWVNEGTDEKPKWGFVSETPGSTLLVRLNTRQKTLYDDATLANLSMPVIIQFLRSYTRMGVANVHCLAGCTCNVQRIQSFHTRHASETAMHGMAVHLLPNNTACDLMFNVSKESVSRGGHKFKVIGVVTTALGYGFASTYGTGSWHIPEDA